MEKRSPSIRELAKTLTSVAPSASDTRSPTAALVNENLRLVLTQIIGADGFASLLRRALSMASVEVPALQRFKLSMAVHLDGIGDNAQHPDREREQAALAVTTQLLELLVTFIGEPLTRRLVRDASPETSPEE
jgi:2-polyprenyl-6-methoxyphenol hydroxylase-like FAD-dependent oxidoreductase